ncbi:MAG: o-succinylbenzoate synthase [bacterium]
MSRSAVIKHTLSFKIPGGTSRGVLTRKDSWYIILYGDDNGQKMGIGECSLIPGLSPDDKPDFREKLYEVLDGSQPLSQHLSKGLEQYPAIRFGLETAIMDLKQGGTRQLFPSSFLRGEAGIPINGLVWMGEYHFMKQQILQKIKEGFRCIKIKVGAIDFEDELRLLKMIRSDFNENELELRVDANGAFPFDVALEKLSRLSEFRIHSIEQPIRQGQWQEMAALCESSPIPIALDEELIGITETRQKQILLETISPQYIILKPSLLGGYQPCESYIRYAERNGIGWWVTSALEGNIGLNAIAQWTATLGNSLPQGLGTGQLFSNNIPSPLFIKNAKLYYDPETGWDLNSLKS